MLLLLFLLIQFLKLGRRALMARLEDHAKTARLPERRVLRLVPRALLDQVERVLFAGRVLADHEPAFLTREPDRERKTNLEVALNAAQEETQRMYSSLNT